MVVVGNELHGLKVKHLHVGGVLGSGKVQNGLRGCIQVSPLLGAYPFQWVWYVGRVGNAGLATAASIHPAGVTLPLSIQGSEVPWASVK